MPRVVLIVDSVVVEMNNRKVHLSTTNQYLLPLPHRLLRRYYDRRCLGSIQVDQPREITMTGFITPQVKRVTCHIQQLIVLVALTLKRAALLPLPPEGPISNSNLYQRSNGLRLLMLTPNLP